MKRLAIAILVLGAAGAARAESQAEKGKKLLAAKKYAEACPALEQADAADPGINSKLDVAKCYEDWGKLAHAYQWYADAAKLAASSKDRRAAKLEKHVEELDIDVPRLTVNTSVEPDLAAAAISLDGRRLANEEIGVEIRVDPGLHELVYQVNGTKKTKALELERGAARELTLELPRRGSRGTGSPDGDGALGGAPGAVAEAHPGRLRRIVGLSMAAAGLASLGVSAYLTIDARDDYKAALDANCLGMANTCDERGLALTRDARSQANLATVFAIAGGAVAIGGVVLYLTAPKGAATGSSSAMERQVYFAPVVGGDGGGFVVGGRY